MAIYLPMEFELGSVLGSIVGANLGSGGPRIQPFSYLGYKGRNRGGAVSSVRFLRAPKIAVTPNWYGAVPRQYISRWESLCTIR